MQIYRIGPNHPVQAVPEKEKTLSFYSFFLEIGAWRTLFSEQKSQVLIAKTLSHCGEEQHIKLVGYLISEKKVCLVLKRGKYGVEHGLLTFFHELKEAIKGLYCLQQNINRNQKNIVRLEKFLNPLFIQYRLFDYNLICLITGRYVQPEYYDQHIERLKEIVRKEKFCSAIDYAGAEGPVKFSPIQYKPDVFIKDHIADYLNLS